MDRKTPRPCAAFSVSAASAGNPQVARLPADAGQGFCRGPRRAKHVAKKKQVQVLK
ncbi:hypothetical protein ATSB10_01070 [Dyella thiooxydans]|uniref:Uncharacterized protein n=1 Tax=Dyella thiooxydans TaxID=445710 RepID=A0A160MWK7_9GAMM|nr:hypothetical protein ATSB10_01070 [Dyella thiooxydans]